MQESIEKRNGEKQGNRGKAKENVMCKRQKQWGDINDCGNEKRCRFVSYQRIWKQLTLEHSIIRYIERSIVREIDCPNDRPFERM